MKMIYNLDSSEIKKHQFKAEIIQFVTFRFEGGIAIGNYYYALLNNYQYIVFDIFNTSSKPKIIGSTFNINSNPVYTTSGNMIFYFGGYFDEI